MTADRSESASRYFDFRLAIGIPLGLTQRARTNRKARALLARGACLGGVLSVGSVFRAARQASSHRSHCFSCCVWTGSSVFARTYDAGCALPLA